MSTATSLVRAVVRCSMREGLDADALVAGAGLDRRTVEDRDARVPTRAYLELFAAASARAANPDFGAAVAGEIDSATFGLLGFVVASCATLREALGRFTGYSRLLCDELRVELAPRGGEVAIVYSMDCTPRVPALFEMALTHLASTSRRGTRGFFRPRRLVFRHDRGASSLAGLLGVPVEFGSEEDAMYCDGASLDLPLRGANAALLQVLESHATHVLSVLPPEDDTLVRARSIIRTLLPGGEPSLESVAARLGLGPRTLQRRLREQGLTFRELVNDVRRQCALELLAHPDVSVAEVAFSLGFSGPSAFHHAFRRWTGRSPGERR